MGECNGEKCPDIPSLRSGSCSVVCWWSRDVNLRSD